MPTYERACDACKHDFEVRRSIKDDSPFTCPKCGGETRQVIKSMPSLFTRNIDHPDSPLDEVPGHERMRKQADMAIHKAMSDMGMNP